MQLREDMQKIAVEWPCYGSRRMARELRDRGWDINRKRVQRLMREDNLLCVAKRKFVVTTDSGHEWKVYPNLAGSMLLTNVDQLWIADITYIRLEEEFVYLAVILDAYSRRVIGWHLGEGLDNSLTLTALRMALGERTVRPGLVHHSDRGVQYASGDYTGLLEENGIAVSMSRKGNPWDKAYASYCTSCEPRTTFSGKGRRLASLTPCAFRGGLGPGSSYSQSSRSFTG
jgi:putative transposase